MTWTVGEAVAEIGPGGALFIPRGATHRYRNTSTETVRELAVVTPGVLGRGYFRELAAALEAGDPGTIDAVMRRHGVTPVW